jgi:hypothetical protein
MTKEDSGLQGRMDDFEFVVVSKPDSKGTKPQPKKPAPKK